MNNSSGLFRLFFVVFTISVISFQTGIYAGELSDLSGTYRIRTFSTDNYLWYEHGPSRLITTEYFSDDDFSRFTLERQPDNSYQIKAKGSGLYLHVNGYTDRGYADGLLSTRFQPNDDFTHFFFESQANGSFRIRVAASGRYLVVNNEYDYRPSTRDLRVNDISEFELLPESFIPKKMRPTPVSVDSIVSPLSEETLRSKPIHPLAIKMIAAWPSDHVQPVVTKLSLNAVYHNEKLFPYADGAVSTLEDGRVVYRSNNGETVSYRRQDLGEGLIRFTLDPQSRQGVPFNIDARIEKNYPFFILQLPPRQDFTLTILDVEAVSYADSSLVIKPPKFMSYRGLKGGKPNGNSTHPLVYRMFSCWPSDTNEPLVLQFMLGATHENTNQFEYSRIIYQGNYRNEGTYLGRSEFGEPDVHYQFADEGRHDVEISREDELIAVFRANDLMQTDTFKLSGKEYSNVPVLNLIGIEILDFDAYDNLRKLNADYRKRQQQEYMKNR